MLEHKIDFAVIVSVRNANPNGDPLNGNRPRVNYEGYGELSDVSIKRKIRNRLMEAGKPIFVQPDDDRIDDYRSLRARAEGELKDYLRDEKRFREEACKKWLDVRAFGQVFAYKGSQNKGRSKKKGTESVGESEERNEGSNESVSIGIRGPVSIHPAFSVNPISISSIQITKSVSGEGDGKKKSSDTMGMKHRVDYGVYVFYGSINSQLASKTGFTDEDAEAIKGALIGLFENDASSARPEGSMEVYRVYWWRHNSKNGQHSSADVHHSLQISLKEGLTEATNIEDYDIHLKEFPDLKPEIISGR
ncbi:MAG: type I-C CRISPR-associated protein Cas7/Csd2 [Candidatus Thermoplasmatota archaeon]|jgi:CRISPR-associated protein Csd2|nr:type I-C CRISPR-associated protein Cas7/Csd2 [Candidatus Thermoplasmatota archaeon]MCL5785792.1 type I-C CRISPR-associated protein Cas7/Csd2 [Candidatus Thermoplasmatota archaeon]